jgi:hypothetical protein
MMPENEALEQPAIAATAPAVEDSVPRIQAAPADEAKPADKAKSEATPAAPPAAPKTKRAYTRRASKIDAAVAEVTKAKATPKAAKPKKVVKRRVAKPVVAAAKTPGKPRTVQSQPVQKRILNVMATATKGPKAELAGLVADVQDKAKVAYEKSTVVAGKVGELVKDNADALVVSGKTLGAGLKELGEGSVADSRKAVATFADDLKALAAVKSTSDLLKLQGELAGRNFDAALGLAAKNGQALRALAGKVFAPLSQRVKTNVETIRKVA